LQFLVGFAGKAQYKSEIAGQPVQIIDEPVWKSTSTGSTQQFFNWWMNHWCNQNLIQQIQGSDGVDPPLLSVPQPVMKHSWSAATSASGRQAVATQSP